mmetsp:Transcript_81045/g.135607  ORF Transcript_81045/g.135607 Transcript_81045/m.135607 type:complete len:335 (+) Transcript_81045:197-1201(+)
MQQSLPLLTEERLLLNSCTKTVLSFGNGSSHVEHRGLCIRLVFIRLTPRHFLKLGLLFSDDAHQKADSLFLLRQRLLHICQLCNQGVKGPLALLPLLRHLCAHSSLIGAALGLFCCDLIHDLHLLLPSPPLVLCVKMEPRQHLSHCQSLLQQTPLCFQNKLLSRGGFMSQHDILQGLQPAQVLPLPPRPLHALEVTPAGLDAEAVLLRSGVVLVLEVLSVPLQDEARAAVYLNGLQHLPQGVPLQHLHLCAGLPLLLHKAPDGSAALLLHRLLSLQSTNLLLQHGQSHCPCPPPELAVRLHRHGLGGWGAACRRPRAGRSHGRHHRGTHNAEKK